MLYYDHLVYENSMNPEIWNLPSLTVLTSFKTFTSPGATVSFSDRGN